jgi:hypothetical protein
MINWIWHNKEWIFSGVGVAIVFLVLRFAHRLSARRKTPPPQPPSPSSTLPDKFTRPTPAEIHRQIKALPPFQQNSGGDLYKGLKVCWTAAFRDISPIGKGCYVYLDNLDREVPHYSGSIICKDVSLDANPRLKIAQVGEQVIVRGTIDGVETGVYLKDATIEFV